VQKKRKHWVTGVAETGGETWRKESELPEIQYQGLKRLE
jgi:hypothetical protein